MVDIENCSVIKVGLVNHNMTIFSVMCPFVELVFHPLSPSSSSSRRVSDGIDTDSEHYDHETLTEIVSVTET